MIKKYTYDGLTWVDLESPSFEEVRTIMDEYSIDPLVAEELVKPTLRPKVDLYSNFIYLILHFPAFRHDHTERNDQEIDFIIGKKVLITARYDNIDSLNTFSKQFEVNSILDKEKIGTHAGFIFFHMMRSLYHSLSDELALLRDELKTIEDNIFKGRERDMVKDLSNINRELLNFKEAVSVHKDVLNSFEAAGKKFFGESFDYHLRGIIGEYYKVQGAIDSSREYLNELRNTNDSLLSTKQNETMKELTVVAFVFMPLSFIAAILGMSMEVPIIHSTSDFWNVLWAMVILGIALFGFFKYKKIL